MIMAMDRVLEHVVFCNKTQGTIRYRARAGLNIHEYVLIFCKLRGFFRAIEVASRFEVS